MVKGEIIGKGMTADVYKWDQNKVLKLFAKRYNQDWVEFEAKKGRIVHEAGIPSPEIFDTISLDKRYGIIMQRIPGKLLTKCMQEEPWNMFHFAKRLARFHYSIHQYTSEGLPSQMDRFTYIINKSSKLSEKDRKKVFDYIESLPNGNSICHGDIHFNNVIVNRGRYIAIDWSSAYQGNPLSDVARTYLVIRAPFGIYETFGPMGEFIQYAKGLLAKAYLDEYIKLSKVKYKDIDAWLLPVAAGKLRDKHQENNKWLLGIINECLKKSNL